MSTKNQVTELENRIIELEKENLLLQEKVAFLTRKLYGRSTEQTSSLGIEGQMSLFDEAETSADPKSPDVLASRLFVIRLCKQLLYRNPGKAVVAQRDLVFYKAISQ